MEMTKGFLSTDEDFYSVLPLIVEFSKMTDSRLVNNMREVMECLFNERYLTAISQLEERVNGYITGYFLNDVDVYLSQAYGKPPPFGEILWKMFEEKVISLGAKKILLHTIHPLRLFSRYGFGFERSLLSKKVG